LGSTTEIREEDEEENADDQNTSNKSFSKEEFTWHRVDMDERER
jgi:hypothetical protein